jgi:hypothetical protein
MPGSLRATLTRSLVGGAPVPGLLSTLETVPHRDSRADARVAGVCWPG